MDQIEIQLQDITGNWRTYQITQNSSLLSTAGTPDVRTSDKPSR